MQLFSSIKQAFNKTSAKFTDSFNQIFKYKKIDADTLDELEEQLIMADCGANLAASIIGEFAKKKIDENSSLEDIKELLVEAMLLNLPKLENKLMLADDKLNVILMSGINGNGKTTSIGKLAYGFKSQGQKVLIVAADTYRAAAIEQLQTWAERAQVDFFTTDKTQDPASVAYQAINHANENNYDIVLIDTAGRLHTQNNLMDQLTKIKRVILKADSQMNLHSLLVVDATTGQNALNQLEVFGKAIEISGLIITKLDGSAKGGIVLNLMKKYNLPVNYIGIGEKITDLKQFELKPFLASFFGKEEA